MEKEFKITKYGRHTLAAHTAPCSTGCFLLKCDSNRGWCNIKKSLETFYDNYFTWLDLSLGRLEQVRIWGWKKQGQKLSTETDTKTRYVTKSRGVTLLLQFIGEQQHQCICWNSGCSFLNITCFIPVPALFHKSDSFLILLAGCSIPHPIRIPFVPNPIPLKAYSATSVCDLLFA